MPLAGHGKFRPAALPAAAPVGGTGATAGGWDTAGNRDSTITTINDTRTVLNDVLRILGQRGIIEDTTAGQRGNMKATHGRDDPAAVPAAAPAGGTGAAAGCYDTSANRDSFRTTINGLRVSLDDIIRILKDQKIIVTDVQHFDIVGAIPAAAPTGGTGADAGGWDTSGNRNSAITTVNNMRLVLIDLVRILQDQGILEP